MTSSTIEDQIKKAQRSSLERALTVAVSGLIILVGLVAAFLLFKYVSGRNAPPKTYYDYQLRIWRGALERSPKDPAINSNIGYIYLKMGNDSKGLEYLNKALAIDKKFVPALYNIGIYHKKQGRVKEAISSLRKAGKYAVGGNKYLAYYSLGELYAADKRYDQAVKMFEESLADNGTMWNTYKQLGDIYRLKKDKEKALLNYKKALDFNPDNEQLKKTIESLK